MNIKQIKTPRQFSFFVSLILAFLSILVSLIVQYLFSDSLSILRLAIVGVVCFFLSYFVIYYFLEKLITSKIRLLYRVIHNNENKRELIDLKMEDDVLGKVEKEVITWGKDKRDQIEKLKEQEGFRREFLGNLAHELKTPIFSIQGYILTLLEGGLEDKKINRKFLERANKGVDRIAKVVEDLDLITEIESGRITLKLQSVNLIELVRDVLESFEIKAKSKTVELKLDYEYENLFVLCDKDKIEQVLINLINNSINYGVKDGFTKVNIHDMEGHVMLEVEDNGIGISKVDQERLFERFYRVDKSRARHEGGTGLGLSIVKHIVEAHQQSINVRSQLEKGAVFYFSLKKA